MAEWKWERVGKGRYRYGAYEIARHVVHGGWDLWEDGKWYANLETLGEAKERAVAAENGKIARQRKENLAQFKAEVDEDFTDSVDHLFGANLPRPEPSILPQRNAKAKAEEELNTAEWKKVRQGLYRSDTYEISHEGDGWIVRDSGSFVGNLSTLESAKELAADMMAKYGPGISQDHKFAMTGWTVEDIVQQWNCTFEQARAFLIEHEEAIQIVMENASVAYIRKHSGWNEGG